MTSPRRAPIWSPVSLMRPHGDPCESARATQSVPSPACERLFEITGVRDRLPIAGD